MHTVIIYSILRATGIHNGGMRDQYGGDVGDVVMFAFKQGKHREMEALVTE